MSHISIKNTNMTDLFWGLYHIADNAIELNFNYNKLTSMSALYGVLIPQLNSLKLQENAIDVIDLTKLHLPVLQFLDIRRNHLIQLDEPSGLLLGSKLTPESPMSFYISGNPWLCSGTCNWLIKLTCNLENDQHDLTFLNQGRTIVIFGIDNLMCESPPEKRGIRVIDHLTDDSALMDDNSSLCGGYPLTMRVWGWFWVGWWI